jgi:serine/threonine protein kinase
MDRRARLEELLAEAHERQASGAPFDGEAFARSFPEFADEIRASLRLLPLADRALGGGVPGAGREAARAAARRMIRAHRDSGVVHDLPWYQQQFPGYWDVVAEEYRAWSLPPPSSSPTVRAPGEDDDAHPGIDRVGSYKVRREIGRGGMGVVYLAEDERLKRNVALKVLSPVFASSRDLQKRFQREAAIASKLDHPGICTVYEAGEAGGIPFIAMRFIHGETLEHWITTCRLAAGLGERHAFGTAGPLQAGGGATPPAAAARPALKRTTGAGTRDEILRIVHLVERAGRALHVAHEASLIHRDIKPGNIMITLEGDPILLDFGLARDEEGTGASITQTGALMGTPAYMSPEQIAAQRIRLDRRTDVYSLGVTLYEAITLRLPFAASSRDSLYQKILVSDPDDVRRLNPAVPVDLKVVIDKSLEKDRDRRYPTALEFAEDLRRVRDNEPVKARPVSSVTRAARWMRRNPGVAVPALAFAGLVVVLPPAAFFLYEKGRQSITGTESLGLTDLNEVRQHATTPEAALALRELQEALRLKEDGDMDGAWEAVQRALRAMPEPKENVEVRRFAKRLLSEVANAQK